MTTTTTITTATANGTVFPVEFIARANYALFQMRPPINFTLQLSKPLLDAKDDGKIDVAKFLTPTELSAYLAHIRQIKVLLQSIDIEEEEQKENRKMDGYTAAVLQLSFRNSPFSMQFTHQFDYTYKDMNVVEMSEHVAVGQSFCIAAIKGYVDQKKTSVSVVSLGCGDGKFNAKYAPLLPAGSKFLLVDLHAAVLTTAVTTVHQNWPQGGGEQSLSSWKDPSQAGIFTLLFDLSRLATRGCHIDLVEPGSVDIVECSLCAHHVPDLAALLREIRRILIPSSGLFVFYDVFDASGAGPPMPLASPFHGIEFFRPIEEVRVMFGEAGLQVQDIQRINASHAYFKAVPSAETPFFFFEVSEWGVSV